MKKIIASILPRSIIQKVLLYKHGYRMLTQENAFLFEKGYADSYLQKKLIDKNGAFLPWMNYGIVDFLNKRLNKELSIFEYGSGFSTIFYAQRVQHITFIEYDKKWFDILQKEFHVDEYSNISLLYQPLDDNYATTILLQEKKYDVVIVDGRKRVQCFKNALERVSDIGVIILDDSSREKYQEIFSIAATNNFKVLTFSGLKPGEPHTFSTTIFYKKDNCFAI